MLSSKRQARPNIGGQLRFSEYYIIFLLNYLWLLEKMWKELIDKKRFLFVAL